MTVKVEFSEFEWSEVKTSWPGTLPLSSFIVLKLTSFIYIVVTREGKVEVWSVLRSQFPSKTCRETSCAKSQPQSNPAPQKNIFVVFCESRSGRSEVYTVLALSFLAKHAEKRHAQRANSNQTLHLQKISCRLLRESSLPSHISTTHLLSSII